MPRFVVLVALAAAVFSIFLPLGARADDRASVERGRTAGRGLLILRNPQVCGIALVHDRCKADVESFLGGKNDAAFAHVPNIGPRPATGLRAFANDGDRSGFDSALAYINSRAATAAMWTTDPRDAALFDAGINDVMMHAGLGNDLVQMLGLGAVSDLANHVDAIPSDALGIRPDRIHSGGAGAPRSGELPFARALASAVDQRIPPQPLAALVYAEGARGDAVLGIALSTTSELIDSPSWLAQADAQVFLDAYFARLRFLEPERRARLETLRATLRGGERFDHDAALKANTEAVVDLIGPGKPRSSAFLMGLLAAQMVYNAAILHDPAMGSMMTSTIGAGAALDPAVPGWAAARAQLALIAPSDWRAQYRLGLHMIDLIRNVTPS